MTNAIDWNTILAVILRSVISDRRLFLTFSATTIVVVATITFFLHLLTKRLWRRNKILIAGPIDSGKTTLFYKLTDQKPDNLLPTLRPCRQNIKVGKRWWFFKNMVELVDLPGNEDMEHFLERELKSANSVIFLIDGTNFMDQITDCVRKLWKILASKKYLPVMLAINKADEGAKVHTTKYILSRLQRDIDAFQRQKKYLQRARSPPPTFSFESHHSPIGVAAVSVLEDDVDLIKAFMEHYFKEPPFVSELKDHSHVNIA